VPARNAAADLPDALDSLWPACDAVLALDDGSTDETLEVLSTHPLVEHVLRNPPRAGWAGWHDGANRNRLLRAAADLEPDWVVFVDADERLAAADGAELRRLVDSAPDPTVAYGFQCVRMWGSTFCEPTYRWVYRLFAHRRGLALPTRRLHFDPVPVTIPRARWIRTDVRLQHLGASTVERIEQRRAKYDDADPSGSYASAMALDGEPRDLVPWRDTANAAAR
jgi:glycosyltransferase involved in cell wall biosynthesis